jgi:hypothetical protein
VKPTALLVQCGILDLLLFRFQMPQFDVTLLVGWDINIRTAKALL